MTQQIPTIHVVDDDASLRRALGRLLRAAGYEVCEYASAAEFLLARTEGAPGCVVLDIRMPGLNGLDLQDGINGLEGALPIVFLTGHGDIPTTVRAMKAGAVDFLTKPVQRDALLIAVSAAMARDAANRATRDSLTLIRSRFEKLTERERAVFTLVVAGKLNKHIAVELGISERTVKAHRAQVMAKLHVTSIAGLVSCAGQLNVPVSES